MSLKTIGEDIALGAAGLVDEVDEEFGDNTDLAAEVYGEFNPGTEAAAEEVENAGGVDAAFDQTFGIQAKAVKAAGMILAAGVLIGVGFWLGRRR